MQVANILFDLDGTLRFNRPSSLHAFCDYAVKLGLQETPQARHKVGRWTHYYWAMSEDLLNDLKTYGNLNDKFWHNYAIRHLLQMDCDPELARELAPQINRYMSEEHRPEDWVPPDVPETLQTLQAAGLKLGVLSNRDEPCNDYLDRLGLAPYFDLALVAGEVSSWKPDPRIFEHALERMGATTKDTLYVGDNYYADILGAQRAGLQAVLIDPEGLFPEAECPVIHTLRELVPVLRVNGNGKA